MPITFRQYNKVNEQYQRTKNGNLVPILQQIEAELNELKSKADMAIVSYKEVLNTYLLDDKNDVRVLVKRVC